ncbi:hypothetical protein ACFCW4_02650 [Streptomyces virginiae]|uniref:DUF7736 domain-containing protein n=1 Tax=Streptomyces virginiae TaxID=1961 RepID=UPI0035D75497
MSEQRAFPLGSILSITTPTLLAPDGMDGLSDLLEWMTGGRLEMWQLLRAADECAPELLRQHPFLEGLTPPPGLDRPDLLSWLASAEAEQGAQLVVQSLAGYAHQDPAEEFVDRAELARLNVAGPTAAGRG